METNEGHVEGKREISRVTAEDCALSWMWTQSRLTGRVDIQMTLNGTNVSAQLFPPNTICKGFQH